MLAAAGEDGAEALRGDGDSLYSNTHSRPFWIASKKVSFGMVNEEPTLVQLGRLRTHEETKKAQVQKKLCYNADGNDAAGVMLSANKALNIHSK